MPEPSSSSSMRCTLLQSWLHRSTSCPSGMSSTLSMLPPPPPTRHHRRRHRAAQHLTWREYDPGNMNMRGEAGWNWESGRRGRGGIGEGGRGWMESGERERGVRGA
eukprot:3723118-Rhodomonas_salina.1